MIAYIHGAELAPTSFKPLIVYLRYTQERFRLYKYARLYLLLILASLVIIVKVLCLALAVPILLFLAGRA